ncbi:MAG: hypothetical protein AUI04_18750 [Candidatus Rokubacteria bacterium 13_2_20CM_2_64_8]|nr:MAG: hypothetical protein AUI04_18750 [Candidatus Rokubacteria bacterium 13_2_20CM_2_64_8]OLC63959.1 MAG: hypothetical protein AUH76_05365 [Candidatus Rokubacteria bacterium 13_1_40CM_4_67_11]
MPTESFPGRGLEDVPMVLEDPIAMELVGRTDTKMITLDGDEVAWMKPGIHHGGREVPARGVQHARPKTF